MYNKSNWTVRKNTLGVERQVVGGTVLVLTDRDENGRVKVLALTGTQAGKEFTSIPNADIRRLSSEPGSAKNNVQRADGKLESELDEAKRLAAPHGWSPPRTNDNNSDELVINLANGLRVTVFDRSAKSPNEPVGIEVSRVVPTTDIDPKIGVALGVKRTPFGGAKPAKNGILISQGLVLTLTESK